MAARNLSRNLLELRTKKIAWSHFKRDNRYFQTSSANCHDILTKEWKEKVLKDRVITSPFAANYVPEISFAQFSFNHMEKHRNKNMIINGLTGETFTFHDSLRLCTKVASALIRMGLKPGEKVAFLSFNQPEYFLSWLAVLAIGGVTTDINPNSIAKEIRDQLDRTQTAILFVHTTCVAAAKEAAVNSPFLRQIVVFGEAEGCVPFSLLSKDDGSLFKETYPIDDPKTTLAQLPCSSGTTGIPKLVCKSHYSFTAMALSCYFPKLLMNRYETDIGLLVLPLYHIFPVFILAADMVVGASNVLLPKFSPETYLNAIQKYRVTTTPMVPPLVLFLLQHELVKEYDTSSLVGITSGAAPVATELLNQLQDKFKLEFARQGYGMTELCPVSVGLNEVNFDKSSVGVPTNQTEVKIVDVETGEALGPNSPGELWARGPTTMTGYLDNAEATAQTLDKKGWVHTGDIGQYSEDGIIYIVDRMKDLIKYKGHQVAPAELESLLLSHPAVKDAAVIGIPDQRAGELTRAYVVTEKEIKDIDLIKFVAEQTAPEKHLHGGVVFLKEIPKSPAGKVLKKDLRKLL